MVLVGNCGRVYDVILILLSIIILQLTIAARDCEDLLFPTISVRSKYVAKILSQNIVVKNLTLSNTAIPRFFVLLMGLV
jgi:hypothetical protein